MKKIFTVIMILLFSGKHLIIGQFVVVSAPVFQGVYQRDVNNNANIPISGQIISPSGVSYKVEVLTRRLDPNGNVIANTANTSLVTNSAPKGLFNGSINRSKGWYSIEIRYTVTNSGGSQSTYTASSKCGVGDVFFIAGQSNGQGVGNTNTWQMASSTTVPEWIVGTDEVWDCRRELENRPTLSKISGFNRIGPAGNNSWCYGVLGKRISDVNRTVANDANDGMPVAFFNTCAGGSSVKNWSDGASNSSTNGYLSGTQWCGNYTIPGESAPRAAPYHQGQPYLTLKNSLNWYAQLFGVRAVLWHQGEADSQAGYPGNASLTRNSSTYTSLLNTVISQSRTHSGISNLPWMIAKVSHFSDNTSGDNSDADVSPPLNANALFVRVGQQGSINANTSFNFLGPLTDRFNNSGTSVLRSDNVHFNEASTTFVGANIVGGITALATLWNTKIDPSSSSLTTFTRTPALPVPPIFVTQSGSNFTFSVNPGGQYCWRSGSSLAPPDIVNTTNCLSITNSITITNTSGPIRCYINTGTDLTNTNTGSKKWQSTAQVSPIISCSSCREGKDETEELDLGINMKLYPNPSDKDFRVEFDVLEDDTHVKLEFFDMVGNSVKVIADGSHAKGHFTYPITENLPTGASICQLKVGEIFISKKMIRVN
jgi:hypothetical protein